MEILNSEYRKANKDHKCQFCSNAITNGSTYNYDTIKGDDGLYTWKSHIHCLDLVSKLDMMDYCDDGVTAQQFYDRIYDYYCDKCTEMQGDIDDMSFESVVRWVCSHLNIQFN